MDGMVSKVARKMRVIMRDTSTTHEREQRGQWPELWDAIDDLLYWLSERGG